MPRTVETSDYKTDICITGRSSVVSSPVCTPTDISEDVVDTVGKQEAQLSQRDRATLRVIEYFAKSLTIIRYDSVEYDVSSY